jgi:hypothetical protein
MARIRIVDEWLRCPASSPTRWRSVMVVAEQWAEQRVLMRAYASCQDQTRPTIVLHGEELAIGPAGTDPHGAWGIHVHPQVDGRAQEIAEALRQAASRLAGAKGNAPRLVDEGSAFDRKRTDNWSPGTPPGPPGSPADSGVYFEPMVAASQNAAPAYIASPPATYVPSQPAAEYLHPSGMPASPAMVGAAPANPAQRLTPVPIASDSPGETRPGHRRRRGWTSPVPVHGAEPGARTALGYESGAGAQSAIVRLGLRPAAAARLGRLVDRTVPAEFALAPRERDVLNALAETERLTARAIASLVGAVDPVAWMDELIAKLAAYGLDIVAPRQWIDGEPTYRLVISER